MAQPFQFKNKSSAPVEIWLEPYGDCVRVPPTGVLQVELTSDQRHPVELHLEDGRLTLWSEMDKVKVLSEDGRVVETR